MTQADSQNHTASPTAPAGFAQRAPSQSWQQAPLVDAPSLFAWVWYKPAHVPLGLIVTVPEETFRAYPQQAGPLTMRKLLHAAGVDPAQVATWQLQGMAYDAMQGTNPWLDAPVPQPAPGLDPNIVVCLQTAGTVPAAVPQVPTASMPADAGALELLERIDADWQGSMETEKELKRLRKKLHDQLGRVKSLNRDLTPLERLHSSNEDKKDWQSARRWLRDCATRLAMCIKDYDIGYTSAAGQRKWFEQMYHEFVVPRKSFEGLLQAQRDYEVYRKINVTLMNAMNTASANAATNGERRAQGILKSIAAKIREAGAKKTALGVIMD